MVACADAVTKLPVDKVVSCPVQAGATTDSALIVISSVSNLLNDILYYCVTCIIVTGMVTLAPESLPIIVIVVCNCVFVPNNVLTVVAVKLIEVPITVLETFVPSVVVEFNAVASGVFTPTPLNEFNTLASAIVAVYPEDSNACEDPR